MQFFSLAIYGRDFILATATFILRELELFIVSNSESYIIIYLVLICAPKEVVELESHVWVFRRNKLRIVFGTDAFVFVVDSNGTQ